MRRMYDGIDPSRLPADGDLYAGYVDGNWPWAKDPATLVHGRKPLRIAAHASTDDGVVGDGPPDNGTWAEWVAWTVRRRAAGADPTVYTNASSWAAGRSAFEAAGVAQPHWWIADYDGDPTIPAGAAAKQYATAAGYDTSAVADHWPGVDPAPAPAASSGAAPIEEESMQIEPLSVHPGEYAASVPSGAKTLTIGGDGYSAPAASFRVVLWTGDKPEVLPTVTLGGASGRHQFGHPVGAATMVTVRRLDSEAYPATLGFGS